MIFPTRATILEAVQYMKSSYLQKYIFVSNFSIYLAHFNIAQVEFNINFQNSD